MSGKLVNRARQLRYEATEAERVLWKFLRKCNLGVKFRRQQPLGSYIVDFISFEARLIIEIDGGQHQIQVAYDQKRTLWLEQQGYRILRFWNNDVLNETGSVLAIIQDELYNHPPRGGTKVSNVILRKAQVA